MNGLSITSSLSARNMLISKPVFNGTIITLIQSSILCTKIRLCAKQIGNSILYISIKEIMAGFSYVRNPFLYHHFLLFSFESDSLLVLAVRALSFSLLSEKFKNCIVLENSHISLQNDSGCKVDLKFSHKEAFLVLNPDQ